MTDLTNGPPVVEHRETPGPSPSTSRGLAWVTRSPWLLVHIGSVLFTMTAMAVWMSNMTWYSDDWSFLDSSRSLSEHGVDALMSSYNQHWSAVSILVYRGVLATFDMSSYLPFAVPLIVAHAANVVLSRVLMLRSGIADGLATLLPLAILFLASAYTDLLWGFPFNLVGSMTIGLLAAWVAARDRVTWVRVLAVALLLLLSTATSNVGVAMTVAVTLFVLLKHGWLKAATVAAVPAAGFVGWYLVWGQREQEVCAAGPDLTSIPAFMAKALEKGFSGVTAITGGSVVVALVIVVALYRIVATRQFSLNAWAISSGMGCLGLYLLSAYGRSGCVDDASRAPRYAYFAILILPLLAVAIDRFWRRGRVGAAIIVLVVATSVGTNFVHMLELSQCRETRVQTAFAQLSFLPDQLSPLNPQVTPGELKSLQNRHGLALGPRAADYPDSDVGC